MGTREFKMSRRNIHQHQAYLKKIALSLIGAGLSLLFEIGEISENASSEMIGQYFVSQMSDIFKCSRKYES